MKWILTLGICAQSWQCPELVFLSATRKDGFQSDSWGPFLWQRGIQARWRWWGGWGCLLSKEGWRRPVAGNNWTVLSGFEPARTFRWIKLEKDKPLGRPRDPESRLLGAPPWCCALSFGMEFLFWNVDFEGDHSMEGKCGMKGDGWIFFRMMMYLENISWKVTKMIQKKWMATKW